MATQKAPGTPGHAYHPGKTQAPAHPKVKISIHLANRFLPREEIPRATVRLTSATGFEIASKKTNSAGNVVFEEDTTKIPDGIYGCSIDAEHTFDGEVGPSLASVGPPPERIYRPATISLTIDSGRVTAVASDNADWAEVSAAHNSIKVGVQPVWLRSPKNKGRGAPLTMIVVHHTAGIRHNAVNTALSEKGPHYEIDVDGQIFKFVQDTQQAFHAGAAHWVENGVIYGNINARSIGIEIINTTGAYPEAQYRSLIGLLGRIRQTYPDIDSWNIVGHSDVGTGPRESPNSTDPMLGRKGAQPGDPGDPGSYFQWWRLESLGLGLRQAPVPQPDTIYGGFFKAFPGGLLQHGDSDATRRFGGKSFAPEPPKHHTKTVHLQVGAKGLDPLAAKPPEITGTPIQELQGDLKEIGYSVGNHLDGSFGPTLHGAVQMLQEHFFAGGRGHKPPDGSVDFRTASLIKGVIAYRRMMKLTFQ